MNNDSWNHSERKGLTTSVFCPVSVTLKMPSNSLAVLGSDYILKVVSILHAELPTEEEAASAI